MIFFSLNQVLSQIVDSNGAQFNSLQQALSTSTNNLSLKSKIQGNCEFGGLSKAINIIGNGFNVRCIDNGLVRFSSLLNISNISFQGLNLQAVESGTLKITNSIFHDTNQIKCDDSSYCVMQDVEIIDSQFAIEVSFKATFQNITEANSTTLISARYKSSTSILNWSRSNSLGNLIELKDESVINISNLSISKAACESSGSSAIIKAKDSSKFALADSNINHINGKDCSIGAFSITSSSSGVITNSNFTNIYSRLFYLDSNSKLSIKQSNFISVRESTNGFITYQIGYSIIALYDVAFKSTIGRFHFSDFSSMLVQESKFLNIQGIITDKIIFNLAKNSKLELRNSEISNADSDSVFQLTSSSSLSVLNSNLINFKCNFNCIDASMNSALLFSFNSIANIQFSNCFIDLNGPYTRVITFIDNNYSQLNGIYIIRLENVVFNSTAEQITDSNINSIYYSDSSSVFISGSTVTNNGNLNSVGTMLSAKHGIAYIYNSTVKNSRANMGGAVYALNSTITITGTTLTANTADDGGSLYISDSVINLSNTSITSNSAIRGGAVFFNNSSGDLYKTSGRIKNLYLLNNTAKQGDDQASEFYYFNSRVNLVNRVANVTIHIKDRFNNSFTSQIWDTIYLLTINNRTDFKMQGDTVKAIEGDLVVFENVKISSDRTNGVMGVVLISDLTTMMGKVVDTINFDIKQCDSNQVELTISGFKQCQESTTVLI
eukprot:NODE_177_length_15815_cov_0.395457.p3 type:complete len:721 gc:universal NODE_177_length_15815_cov_0.395457:7285-9447(+)